MLALVSILFLLLIGLFIKFWLHYGRYVNSVAFFHPECAGLGGGERVLWCIIRALLEEHFKNPPDVPTVSSSCDGLSQIIIYSAAISPRECLINVKDRFGIDLLPWYPHCPSEQNKISETFLKFVPLSTVKLIDPHLYPRFTLALQSLGSMIVALEALLRYPPQIFIDTTGYSFTLGIASWLGGCRVSSYIHYPTISKDMIRSVKNRDAKFNNSEGVAISRVLTFLKLLYYWIFAWFYGFCGGFMDSCVVNSSWTYSHIVDLMTDAQTRHKLAASSFSSSGSYPISSIYLSKCFELLRYVLNFISSFHRLPVGIVSVVYPPCDIKAFVEFAKPSSSRIPRIVSLSQFRPEKNHQLQLESMAKLFQLYKERNQQLPKDLELLICGTVRDHNDELILNQLKKRSVELGLGDRVRFEVNISFNRVKELLGSSKVGIHTMIDEHFGIALVEFLAAGLLVVAHNSAGPNMDILNISPIPTLCNSTLSSRITQASSIRHEDDPDDVIILETPRRTRSIHEDEGGDCVSASFGYLCLTANGFAEALYQCLTNSEESLVMLKRVPSSMKRFNSNENFGRKCIMAMNINSFFTPKRTTGRN